MHFYPSWIYGLWIAMFMSMTPVQAMSGKESSDDEKGYINVIYKKIGCPEGRFFELLPKEKISDGLLSVTYVVHPESITFTFLTCPDAPQAPPSSLWERFFGTSVGPAPLMGSQHFWTEGGGWGGIPQSAS